jgi:hypothetical protein
MATQFLASHGLDLIPHDFSQESQRFLGVFIRQYHVQFCLLLLIKYDPNFCHAGLLSVSF